MYINFLILNMKLIKKQIMIFGWLFLALSCGRGKSNIVDQIVNESQDAIPSRYVKKNVLVSHELPEIEIQVSQQFKFIGEFDFEIIANSDEYPPEFHGNTVASGTRFVFVSADEKKKVNKLFIVQLEGFLEHNSFTYNYNFDKADFIGNNKYRHNTWFYDSKKLAETNPHNEGAKTRSFLENKGYVLEDHFMMSRFLGLASEDRKNEIIIFYLEMMKQNSGYSLEEYENTLNKEEVRAIRSSFVERSKKSFKIIKG